MFAIYGTSGLMYRGPVEDLRKVAPALRTPRVRALAVGLDLLLATPTEPDTEPAAGVPPRPGPHGQAQAVQAYAAVQQPPQRRPLTRVADVMSPEPVLVPDSATVQQAWDLLATQGVGQVPVVNAQRQLVGLLTRAELMRPDRLPQSLASALAWRAYTGQPVTALMLTPVPSVSADTDLRRLALLLLETGLPGVPVVEDAGVVQGFVARSDILKAVVHDPPLDLWAG